MASAVDSRLAYARLSAVATASRLPTATRGSNNSYTTHGDTTPTSDRTSLPSAAAACPRTGPSATTPHPCSSRPSSRPRATPAPSTGLRAGSMSEPPRAAAATTATSCSTSRARTSGSGPSEKIGNEPSPYLNSGLRKYSCFQMVIRRPVVLSTTSRGWRPGGVRAPGFRRCWGAARCRRHGRPARHHR